MCGLVSNGVVRFVPDDESSQAKLRLFEQTAACVGTTFAGIARGVVFLGFNLPRLLRLAFFGLLLVGAVPLEEQKVTSADVAVTLFYIGLNEPIAVASQQERYDCQYDGGYTLLPVVSQHLRPLHIIGNSLRRDAWDIDGSCCVTSQFCVHNIFVLPSLPHQLSKRRNRLLSNPFPCFKKERAKCNNLFLSRWF